MRLLSCRSWNPFETGLVSFSSITADRTWNILFLYQVSVVIWIPIQSSCQMIPSLLLIIGETPVMSVMKSVWNWLCFYFQQQQLIELIREGRVEDALKFASEQLAERGEEEPVVLEELERTLALLAFEDPSQSPFSDLLSHSHRQKVCFFCFVSLILQ